VHIVNIHIWPHGSCINIWTLDYKVITHCHCHLTKLPIWYETIGVMIVFNMLFIPNVLQKPNLNIIIFFILCPNGTIKKAFSKMYTSWIFLNKKNYLIWLQMHLNLASKYISTMMYWRFCFLNHYYLSHILAKWQNLNFI